MKYYATSIFLAIFSAIIPTASFSQAFGIEMGTNVDELDLVEDIGDFQFIINPPKPVSGFVVYAVKATPAAGVCVVRGISSSFKNDGYGLNVRDRFEELRRLLDKNYGKGEIASELRPGALWDEVDEWVMAIRQNERFHQADWQVNDPEGLDDIILAVRASSRTDSYLALQYRFSNKDECDAEAAEADAGGL